MVVLVDGKRRQRWWKNEGWRQSKEKNTPRECAPEARVRGPDRWVVPPKRLFFGGGSRVGQRGGPSIRPVAISVSNYMKNTSIGPVVDGLSQLLAPCSVQSRAVGWCTGVRCCCERPFGLLSKPQRRTIDVGEK